MPARSRRWKVAAAVAIAGLTVAALILRVQPPPRPPRTITDARFVAAANELCREQLPPLRADPQQNRREERNEAATARRVEAAADGIDSMVDDLAGLRVDPADQAEVERWIRAWRRYVAEGRRYAEAVRSEDAEAFSRLARESRDTVLLVGRFARANRIDACIPR